jgi:hypothetical protein
MNSENGSMAKIVWTPAGAERGLGLVVMERPAKPLTLEEYRWMLELRIRRMVERAPTSMVRRMKDLAWENESLILDPKTASETLAWDSEILANKTAMFQPDWPIPPSQISQELEPTPEQMSEEILEDFLGALYDGR